MTLKWTLEQNDWGRLADRLESEAVQIAPKVGGDVHGTAVANSPFDTGNLAGSHVLVIEQDGSMAIITVEAFYGLYVHEGHHTRSGSYVAGRPWFREAFAHYLGSFNGAVFMLLRPV